MFSQEVIIEGWVASGLTFAGFLAICGFVTYLALRKSK